MTAIRAAGFLIPCFVLVWMVLRRVDRKKRHRSLTQWLIFCTYSLVRFGYAWIRAIDVGYLEYRRILEEPPPVIENERRLGRILGQVS